MDVRVLMALHWRNQLLFGLLQALFSSTGNGNGSMKKAERTCKIGRHGDDLVSLSQVGTTTDSMEPPELAIGCPSGYKKPFSSIHFTTFSTCQF